MEKNYEQYAGKLALHIADIFNEKNPNHIDEKELMDYENFKQFMFALTTLVPVNIYNAMCETDSNTLEFNHLCNLLVFEYSKLEDDEKTSV